MAFENKPLKTAAQLAMEKVSLEEKKKPEESKKEIGGLKSAAEIASEGGPKKRESEYAKRIQEENNERMAAEAKIDEEDKKKIEAIGAEFGLDVSGAVAKKEEKIKAETGENTQNETLGEKNQKIIDATESDYEKTVRETDAMPETLEEKNQKIIDATESDYEKTVRETDAMPDLTEAPKAEEVASNEAVGDKGAVEMKEEIQTEALKDFTNELKGIKKNELWKEDPIMQGMEDFANSFKEKTPMTETLKDMFSFIKKKGAEINSGRLTAKKAIGEFSKKSSEWAKKIFGGAEIGQSDEALRIDELASGGNRSIEAIKVDQAMGRAREAGEAEKMADFESKIGLVTSFHDVLDLMGKVKGFQGSAEFYSSEDQIKNVKKFFATNDSKFLKTITRANGLRKNVKRVYDLVRNQQEEFMKKAA
jgi:hypothetical protein